MLNLMTNMDAYKLAAIRPFGLNASRKKQILLSILNNLHKLHYQKSPEYKKISDLMFNGSASVSSISQLPFLPIGLFKKYGLKSISDNKIFKILTSSGTSGQHSRIFLDAETAKLQSLALSSILKEIIGNDRLPMLLIESRDVIKNSGSFSARGAGLLGFSLFGRDHHYLIKNDEFDQASFKDFLSKYNGQKILIFGFTFLIWKFLYLNKAIGNNLDLSHAILIHGGGWKKMSDLAVDNKEFKKKLANKFGVKKIYNFYGMAEQAGSIYPENNKGFLHCSNFSDIIIRNPKDLSVQPNGKEGLIQVISALSKSYPGYSILTDDIGVCIGEDLPGNAWKGKYFKIIARAPESDLRGCSDTFAYEND